MAETSARANLEEQRRYYESLIEVSPTAIVTGDRNLVVTSWNPAAESLFGYTSQEAIGRPVNDLVANSDEIREEALAVDTDIHYGPATLVSRRTRKDGSLVDVSIRAAPIVVDGELAGFYAFFDDISELVRQRKYFESLLEISPAAVVVVDRDFTVSSWNPAAEELFGYSAAEAVGGNLDDMIATTPELHEEANRYTEEAWRAPIFHRLTRRTRKDGSLVDVEINAAPVLEDGEAVRYYIIYHDITELVRQRRLYESLIEVSPVAVLTVDQQQVVTSWNPAAERLFGYTAQEAIGVDLDDLVANRPEIHDEAVAFSHEAWHKEVVHRLARRTRKDGTLVDVDIQGVPVMLEGEAIAYYIIYHDVTELVRQRRFFESLTEISPVAVTMVDRQNKVTTWNPAATELFGYSEEEALGRDVDELVGIDPDIRAQAAENTAKVWREPLLQHIARRNRKDGGVIDVDVSAAPVIHEGEAIGYYIIYHDVTALQQARRQLEHRVDELLAEAVRSGELTRFIPRQVAEGLLAGQLAPEQALERRRITALFADMVGFTDLSETLEPEELSEVLNEYLREMTAAVMAHGGTLDNFIGDGIMAVFGAPEQMPETAQALAAVRAAFDMRTRCRELGKRLRTRGIPADLDIRVGVNTGHCTVGVFGSEVMRAYKSVGFAVNVAARLQSAGDPGSVLCGFRTYALIQDRVRAEKREPLMVKGSSRPVEAWEILELVEGGQVSDAP